MRPLPRLLALLVVVLGLLWLWSWLQPAEETGLVPWGPGKNAFDCEKGTTVAPLDPTLTPDQRERVLTLLRDACRGK